MAHNRPAITWYRGGSLLKSSRGLDCNTPVGGKRGKIRYFSEAARRRMIRFLCTIKRDAKCLFMTLTFPNDYPTVKEAKRILCVFERRLKRRWPEAAGIIKIEPQKRGAPHFHGLIWNISQAEYCDFLLWVIDNWYELAGQKDPNHKKFLQGLLPGSKLCVEPVKSWNGVMWYTAKYLAKTIEEFHGQFPGRFWWVINREKLPFAEMVEVPVSDRKALVTMRYMRRFAKIKSRNYPSLTISCRADHWAHKLEVDVPLTPL
jgi:hypothetical protein